MAYGKLQHARLGDIVPLTVRSKLESGINICRMHTATRSIFILGWVSSFHQMWIVVCLFAQLYPGKTNCDLIYKPLVC